MSLTTIDTAKETPRGYLPVFLFDFLFPDGTASHVAEWDLTYLGTVYQPRVVNQQINAIEALSPTGIDVPPEIRLTLADADKTMYLLDRDHGFRGARVTVTFVFYDFTAEVFSSDSAVPFVGRCSMPAIDDETLTVSAGHILNLAAKMVPNFPIQMRCPKVKPRSADQVALADVPGSLYFDCGSHTTDDCGYIKIGCAANNDPLNFGGFPYETPPASRSREYTSGDWVDNLKSDPCATKYGDYAPIGFGTCWVDCLVLGSWPEGNSTRGEALICEGRPASILKVTVNDEELPCAQDINGNGYSVADKLFRYNVYATGDRTGALTTDVPYSGNGDPHGSTCVILWCVNRKVTESTPRVRALIAFPQVTWYQKIDHITDGVVTFGDNAPNTDVAGNPPYSVQVIGNSQASYNNTFALTSWAYGPPGTVTLTTGITGTGTGGFLAFSGPSSNFAWAILALLTRRAGIQLADVDLASFSKASQRFKEQVTYTDQDGNSVTHDRYACSLTIRNRRSVADVLTGMLRACDSHLGRNSATGAISLFHRSTLAVQQPAAQDGSNDNTPIGGGYLAYHFDESSIARVKGSDKSTFTKLARAGASIPNSVTVQFTNSENDYSGDSARILDSDDINRMGQEIPGNFSAEGLNTLDHAKRVGARYLAEQLYGDSYTWQTSVKGLRLVVGAIVAVSSVKYDLTAQLMRIQKLAPAANYSRVEITATIHDDAWYDDSFGQSDDPERGNSSAKPKRPPYPLHSGYTSLTGTFGVTEVSDGKTDGGGRVRIGIDANVPKNSFSQSTRAPRLTSATLATTGGSLSESCVVGVISVDASGRVTQLSNLITVPIPSGSTNKITLGVHWFSGADHGEVYAGPDVNHLTLQAVTTGTPSTYDLTSLVTVVAVGPPDYAADHFAIRARGVLPGVWTLPALAVASDTVQFDGVAWTVNEWAGRTVSLLAQIDTDLLVIELDCEVLSNTADTLTLDVPFGLDLVVNLTLDAGAVFTMRTAPTATSTSVQDAAWTLPADALVGKLAYIAKGTGAGQSRPITANTTDELSVDPPFDVTPDATSRVLILDSEWLPEVETGAYTVADYAGASPRLGAIEVPNVPGECYQVQVLTASADGQRSAESASPFRELYIRGTRGTEKIEASATLKTTQRLVPLDTSGVSGFTTTLGAAIAAPITVATAITVVSGTHIKNGTYIEIGSEKFFVESGEGTTTPTVIGGQLGTTAATHSNGATVNIGGALVVTMQPIAGVPNQGFIFRKVTSDLNYAVLHADTADTFEGGATEMVLADDTADRGQVALHAVEQQNLWWQVSGVGAAGTSSSGGGGSNPAPIIHTLTANYTVPMPTPTDGEVLTVILTQDGTGGWTADFGATAKFAPKISSGAGTADAGTTSVIRFSAYGGYWWNEAIGRKQ